MLPSRLRMAVKSSSGPKYYVRLRPEVAEPLHEGQKIRVAIEIEPWLKPADRIIDRFSQEHGGIYDPPRHQRDLERLARPSRDDREGATTADQLKKSLTEILSQ